MTAPGRVSIVGAGPGAPDLITVRGLHRLRAAQAVVYDRLVDPLLLTEAPATAEKVFVGKAPGRSGPEQQVINEILIRRARVGLTVVRLKGGDPFVFGRGGEEVDALRQAGIPFEVVPGLSSAVAVPTHAGIPLTRRGVASSFAVIAGHRAGDGSDGTIDLRAAATADTLVILMGVARLDEIVRALRGAGRAADTPVALIEHGTTERERTLSGTLQDIAARAATACVRPPAIIVVGEVAASPYSTRDVAARTRVTACAPAVAASSRCAASSATGTAARDRTDGNTHRVLAPPN